jgi:hypothetical protein
VRAPPICRKPVGEGAKRVTISLMRDGVYHSGTRFNIFGNGHQLAYIRRVVAGATGIS